MDSAKNVRRIISFKKFDMVRVKKRLYLNKISHKGSRDLFIVREEEIMKLNMLYT